MRLSKVPYFSLGLYLLACLSLAACSEQSPRLPRLAAGDVVLAFGDSLTYGTGASRQQSYPVVLSELIGHNVVSSGVPGEQTAEGLERLPEALDTHQPRILLLCLGGNDMLRKVDAAETEANLRQMVDIAQDRGVAVVLIGVPAPALFGATAGFYKAIAQDYAIAFEGDALNEILRDNGYKSDPVHPNAHGYRVLATALADLLRRAGAV